MLLPASLVAVLLAICEGRANKREAESVCNISSFANLDACCKTPQFFAPNLVKSCIAEIGKTNSDESVSDFQTPDEFSVIQEFLSGAGGPMIAVDCMFRNQSLVQSSGRLQGDNVVEYFLKKSPTEWHELINSTLVECAHSLRKLNVSQMLEQEYANMGPAFLMTCLRRHLFINCPKSAKENTDSSCEAKLESVKTCEPFSLSSGDEGDTGGWMRGLLRWLVGTQTWGTQSVKPETPKSFFLPNFLHVPMSFIFPFG